MKITRKYCERKHGTNIQSHQMRKRTKRENMEKIGIIIGLKKNKLKEHQKSYREANKSKKS